MSPPQRRRFERPLGERRYRKLFVISTEGAKTEKEYFHRFKAEQYPVLIKCLDSKHKSSPLQVLDKIKTYLAAEQPNEPLEAWVVVDRDNYREQDLAEVVAWAKANSNYHLAVSNPNFEYWLLLHFENSRRSLSSKECLRLLRKHWSDYNKGVDHRKISDTCIMEAIARAEQQDHPDGEWPDTTGTRVYKLVKQILEASQPS